MSAKHWFLVRAKAGAIVNYLFTADGVRQVEEIARTINPEYDINELTWHELSQLTHGTIPAGQNPHSLASGNILIPRSIKPDVVLWPL